MHIYIYIGPSLSILKNGWFQSEMIFPVFTGLVQDTTPGLRWVEFRNTASLSWSLPASGQGAPGEPSWTLGTHDVTYLENLWTDGAATMWCNNIMSPSNNHQIRYNNVMYCNHHHFGLSQSWGYSRHCLWLHVWMRWRHLFTFIH